jgi:hypothetical protein
MTMHSVDRHAAIALPKRRVAVLWQESAAAYPERS